MGLRVWDGGKSKRLPVMGRIGVELVVEGREQRRAATLLHVKTGRLPPGRSSRENSINHPKVGKQMTAGIILLVRPLAETLGSIKLVS